MSAIKYTKDQEKVIVLRDRNLLVSAAAGSGKTAVLVERIIRMITDNEVEVSIDQLLVVTFTNAAATEMRERIGEALYERIEADPSNHKLKEQLTLLPGATIMTLHAFCLRVIREHFYKIELDPNFTIGEEATLTLLKGEALEETIEGAYEINNQAFIDFVDGYAPGKSDKGLEELILSVYDLSRSHPSPFLWLRDSVDRLKIETMEAWFGSDYMKVLNQSMEKKLLFIEYLCQEARRIIDLDQGLLPVLETIKHYEDQVKHLISLDRPEERFEQVGRVDFVRAKSPKKDVDEGLKVQIKGIRDQIKEGLKDLALEYVMPETQGFLKSFEILYKHMDVLRDLIETFTRLYAAKKEAKRILDFSDIEHFALEILYDGPGKPSEVAASYRKGFYEILMDEYQDSNLVQETLIQAVSTFYEPHRKPNVFMVGDVKQSIYKFRLAKPELFIEKYDAYELSDGDYQKIELHQNFRSRRQVLDFTNYLFYQLMTKAVGDVDYDEHAALHQGAVYQEDDGFTTDIVLIEPCQEVTDAEALEDQGEDVLEAPSLDTYATIKPGALSPELVGSLNIRELEAICTAREIEGIMASGLMVYDKKIKGVRQVAYKDIVILLRTMSGWSETFVKILGDYGIPIKSNTATGYFDTIEVQTLLNLLRIIDNPKQDLPLLSVLMSPIYGFSGDDMVTIRQVQTASDLHTALMLFKRSIMTQGNLEDKVIKFCEDLERWQGLKRDMDLADLIRLVLWETGYEDYVGFMLGGRQRVMNLKMFVTMANRYDQGRSRGLFKFIRYIERIRRQSVDFGEAPLVDEGKDQVTIMSIHGSKGLEFPVVIMAGLDKKFNMMDLRKPILLHQDYGFGSDILYTSDRIKRPSLTKIAISKVLEGEMKSEELRILYVALTRAREKLVLIGHVGQVEKALKKAALSLTSDETVLPELISGSAKSYLEWILLGILRHPVGKKFAASYGVQVEGSFSSGDIMPDLTIQVTNLLEPSQPPKVDEKSEVETIASEEELNKLKQMFEWVYPYSAMTQSYVSQTVSGLKRQEAITSSQVVTAYRQEETYRPLFISGDQPLTGAEKGTVFHRLMNHMDLSKDHTLDTIQEAVDNLVTRHVFTAKEASTLYYPGILSFFQTDLAKTLKEAARKQRVYKEEPFVMGIEAMEGAHDLMMIQGVIDLFVILDKEIWLLDYKTDFLENKDPSILIDRYQTQMKYYKMALEQSRNLPVTRVFLYSVSASKLIEVD